jgi:hypothetical protein
MAASSVETYSGHTYAQEPRALVWQGQRLAVTSVEWRWRTPEGPAFRVRTEPGSRFTLRFLEREGTWLIEALPRERLPRESTAPEPEISDDWA